MQISRVTSNSLLILFAEITDRAMRFVLVIFAARILGDADFGKLAFAIAFGSLFLILADFGLHQLLIREIARKPEDAQKLLGNGLVLKLLLAGLTFLCIYFAAQFTNKPSQVLLTVYIVGGSLIAGSFADFFSTVFQGFQRMKYEAAGSLILSVSNTLIGVVVLLLGGGFLQLAWVYLISRSLKIIYSVAMVALRFVPVKISFEKKLTRYLLKEGAGFGVSRFFSMIYTYVDSTMLSLMVGDAVVGWYNVAYRLIFAMMVLPMGIMRAVYPALSAYHKSNKEAFALLFQKTFKFMFAAGTSMATVLFVLSDKIILLLFGEEYHAAAQALRILVWSTAIYAVGTVMTHSTRAAGKQGFTAKVVAGSALMNVLLNFVLIPKYSFVGAAFATLMSEFLTFTFHFWYVSRYMVKPPFFRLWPKIVVVNVGTAWILWLMIDFSLFIVLGAAVPVNLGLMFLVRIYSKDELLSFYNMFKPIRGSNK
ncbi:MAG: flippase [bacterium]